MEENIISFCKEKYKDVYFDNKDLKQAFEDYKSVFNDTTLSKKDIKINNGTIKNLAINNEIDCITKQQFLRGVLKYNYIIKYFDMEKLLKNNMCVFDIGANIGIFSSWISCFVSNVYAFEPLSELSEYQNKLFQNKNIKVINKAVSYKNGTDEIYIPTLYASSSLKSAILSNDEFNKDDIIAKRNVETITIDSFVGQENIIPNFIKIDAEGNEWNIIKGSLNTIKEYKPILMIFLHKQNGANIPFFENVLKDYKIEKLVSPDGYAMLFATPLLNFLSN